MDQRSDEDNWRTRLIVPHVLKFGPEAPAVADFGFENTCQKIVAFWIDLMPSLHTGGRMKGVRDEAGVLHKGYGCMQPGESVNYRIRLSGVKATTENDRIKVYFFPIKENEYSENFFKSRGKEFWEAAYTTSTPVVKVVKRKTEHKDQNGERDVNESSTNERPLKKPTLFKKTWFNDLPIGWKIFVIAVIAGIFYALWHLVGLVQRSDGNDEEL